MLHTCVRTTAGNVRSLCVCLCEVIWSKLSQEGSIKAVGFLSKTRAISQLSYLLVVWLAIRESLSAQTEGVSVGITGIASSLSLSLDIVFGWTCLDL